jgi:ribonuclease HI
MTFYAVANGRSIGIFLNWNDCNNSVKGYKNALYKKFDTKEDADNFIKLNEKIYDTNNNNTPKHNVWFHSHFEADAQRSCARVAGTEVASPENLPIPTLSLPLCPRSRIGPNDNIVFNPDYYVYTDGACSNNGRDNALAGIGIFFGINDNRNISKQIEGKQTNNTAELSAIIETYYIIENDILNGKKIAIVSDSEYAIKCVSSYGEKCYNKSWNIDIPNKELVKTAYEMYKDKLNIQFIHIKAHTHNTDIHSFGNDNADKLANIAIGLESCPYNTSTKIYLIIPFTKKDEIKKLGGIWDSDKKKWFVYDNNKNIEKILTIFSKEKSVFEM